MSADDRPVEPVEYARLVAQLRELRARTGLSLAALGDRTPYSKSSWGRYLSGDTLPPRDAVERLCVLAGVRPGRPLAHWELAETALRSRAACAHTPPVTGPPVTGTAAPDDPPEPVGPPPVSASPARPPAPPAPGRPRRHGLFAIALAAAVAVLVTGGVFLSTALDGEEPTGTTTDGGPVDRGATGGGQGTEAGLGTGCTGEACTGKDPESSRCSHASVPPGELGVRDFGGGTVVRIRQSVVCDAVWARVDRGAPGDRVEITAPGQTPQQAEVTDRFDAAGSVSTPMVAAREAVLNEVRVCLVRQDERRCFHATV